MKKIDDILEPGGVINLNADVENPHFEFLISVATAVQKLIDAHNELLETHTVKEERVECHCGNGVDCPEECCALCECATYEDGVHTKSTCNTPIDCPCHKEEVKEEPTTLEKKYCDDCKKYELGVNCQCVCHGVLPRHQGESETWYKIECRNCGSGKELYYFVEFKPIPYNRINTETRSTEKRCPSCLSLDVEATKI